MNPFFSGPQIVSLIVALAVLGLAVAGIVWVGRVIRGELGSSGTRGTDPRRPAAPKRVPPAMMKKEPIVHGQAAPPVPVAAVAAVVPVAPAAPALPADVPPAMRALLDAEKPRFWCPMCGTELQLPTFPPLVSRCSNCGKKSAIRAEEGGRYVVIVSPPPTLS
jgi:predicted RNA-binding Zn-ribbon protein involved in translation (DUF1610 family)